MVHGHDQREREQRADARSDEYRRQPGQRQRGQRQAQEAGQQGSDRREQQGAPIVKPVHPERHGDACHDLGQSHQRQQGSGCRRRPTQPV
jgi:hypothetical protein